MLMTDLPAVLTDFAELEHPSDIRISGAEELTLRVSRDPQDYAPVRHRIKCGMSNRFHGWNCDFDEADVETFMEPQSECEAVG